MFPWCKTKQTANTEFTEKMVLKLITINNKKK